MERKLALQTLAEEILSHLDERGFVTLSDIAELLYGKGCEVQPSQGFEWNAWIICYDKDGRMISSDFVTGGYWDFLQRAKDVVETAIRIATTKEQLEELRDLLNFIEAKLRELEIEWAKVAGYATA